ncbi:MAG: DNA polymerase III subunit delta [Clostridia bacterium]|nr:DNA polymerase III subunit delta [Clostridia bacterium]
MINVTNLKQNIKKGIIKNVYIFCGEETFLIDSYTKKITDILLKDSFKEFNYSSYNEDNESFEHFSDDINSYPTMSEKKIVILKNVKFTKLKDLQKPLCSLIENIPDYVTLIIIEDDIGKIKKPILDAVSKKGDIVDFKKQNTSDLRAWVTANLARAGKDIMPKDAEYLVNICERSLQKLSVECSKLCSVESKKTITKDIIDEMVHIPVEYRIFDMTDKLLLGDAQGAYLMLENFKLFKIQPIVIFSVIYGQLGDLLMFRLLSEEGEKADAFLTPNKKWMANRLYINCKKYSKEKLRLGMRLCAKYDTDVKQGKAGGYAALEVMMTEILIKN